jgi:thymidine phosphorylase
VQLTQIQNAKRYRKHELEKILRSHKSNNIKDSQLTFKNKDVGYFFMERSEEEAALVRMLDIGAIVEQLDSR